MPLHFLPDVPAAAPGVRVVIVSTEQVSVGQDCCPIKVVRLQPSVSVGNVGQLSLDLLLSSLTSHLSFSSVDHPALLPIASADAIDQSSKKLMTACQVYYHSPGNLYLFQIRSSLAKGKRDDFLEDLLSWCQEQKAKEVILLGSSSAEERLDQQLSGSQLRFVTSLEENRAIFQKLGWTSLELRDRFPGLAAGREAKEEDGLFIPGGGFAKRAIVKAKEMGLPATLLLGFCSEGDNRPDAAKLVRYFDEWQDQLPKDADGKASLRAPSSWDLLFGNAPPAAVF